MAEARARPGPEAEEAGEAAAVCVAVLLGLPGAGKTALARGLRALAAAEAARGGNGDAAAGARTATVTHVEFDAFHPGSSAPAADATCEAGGGAFDPAAWRQERGAALAHLEATVRALAAAAADNGERSRSQRALVIVDDNMYYRSMRYRVFQLARRSGAAYVQVHVAAGLEAALERNAGRAGAARVPDGIVRRMAAALQAPRPDVFPWERASLEVPGGVEASAAAAWAGVLGLWGAAPAPALTEAEVEARRQAARERGQRGNERSVVHAVDLWSRQLLAAAVRAAPPPQQRAAAAALQARRRALVDFCRGHSRDADFEDRKLEVCAAFEAECSGAALGEVGGTANQNLSEG